MLAARSWRLLSRDPELLGIAALASAAFAAVAAPGMLFLGASHALGTGEVGFWLVLVAASTLSLCAVAVSPIRPGGRARAGRLLRWTAVTAALSVARNRSDAHLGSVGRPVVRWGSAGFRVLSMVVLPLTVFRDLGPAEGVRRAAYLARPARSSRASPVLGRRRRVVLMALAAAAVVTTGGLAPEVAVVVLVGTWTVVVLTVTSALVGTSSRRHRSVRTS